MENSDAFCWSGKDGAFLDEPTVTSVGEVAVGRYGGSTKAGAHKNEDGALVWHDINQSWTLAVLLDAHAGSDSTVAVLSLIEKNRQGLQQDLALPVEQAFEGLQKRLVAMFSAASFLAECRSLSGETACLICVQKGKYLWWFSVGDCVLYLLHPELTKLGQFALNQRQFFEWIGRVNTFDNPVPAFTVGTRELRGGLNHIVMLTDGLLEFGKRPFEDGEVLTRAVLRHVPAYETVAQKLLEEVHANRGQDSATIICWGYNNTESVAYPSG